MEPLLQTKPELAEGDLVLAEVSPCVVEAPEHPLRPGEAREDERSRPRPVSGFLERPLAPGERLLDRVRPHEHVPGGGGDVPDLLEAAVDARGPNGFLRGAAASAPAGSKPGGSANRCQRARTIAASHSRSSSPAARVLSSASPRMPSTRSRSLVSISARARSGRSPSRPGSSAGRRPPVARPGRLTAAGMAPRAK